jgi:hypothetical protein
MHPIYRSTELHTAVVCACMPTLRPFLRSCSFAFQGDSAGSDTMSLHIQNRPAQRALEQDKEADDHIELHTPDLGTTPYSYHKGSGVVVNVQGDRHNTSEESILDTRNSIPTESHVTFSADQDIREND